MAKVFTITEGLENMGALKTGGQGSVYKGRRRGEIITAIKLLPTPIHNESEDDKHFRDFQNEVNKLKKVNEKPNPNVVKIMSSGITETGSFPFIEMEFIEGPDLEDLLKPPHDPVFTIKEAIRVAEHLSNALAHCHRVDVKHGDVKSNNVKYNIHTGNYVLLDFGMAMMSDEQRRTSLRHAGAIEFMAPEQNEGRILFQTDVYSFGVVLFELLAGSVPFPLRDRGETSRNMVMVAHMEAAVPDLLSLRRIHMPSGWPEEKKEKEMAVPDWLITTVYRCLEKKPEARFDNGIELHNQVVHHRISSFANNDFAIDAVRSLRLENEKLKRENEQLLRQVQDLESTIDASPSQAAYVPPAPPLPDRRSRGNWLLIGLVLVLIIGVGYAILENRKRENPEVADNPSEPTKPRTPIGQYKVVAQRAYFHNDADPATRRSGYMVPSNDVVTALDEKNNFIYTEFTNSRGQTSKGWLRKADLLTLDQWTERGRNEQAAARMKQEDINSQLREARELLSRNELKEAAFIYNYLAGQNVPEAMYEYGNLGLKRQVNEMGCAESYDWVKKASDKGYVPAKRTLGFLALFADNREILQINGYQQCEYERNVYKGTKLLTEAMIAGDTTARRLLDQLNLQQQKPPGTDSAR